MRKTRINSLLIEINGDADLAKVVRSEMERSMGTGMVVRMTQRSSLVEFRDLDGTTTTKVVTEGVLQEFNVMATDIIVLNIRKTYYGGQAGTI